MTPPRVVYLSAPPRGEEMLAFLRTLPCEVIVYSTTDVELWGTCGEFELGLNFLGTRKVPEDWLSSAKNCWVNFHPAPLPQFRGRNLCYQAILDGAEWFGATAHYMDENFDTGDIIEVKKWPVYPSMTAGDLHGWAIASCIQLFKEWVPKLLQGRVPATPQPKEGRYYRKCKIDDEVHLDAWTKMLIRARTYHPKHHARVKIGERWYKIVPEE